MIQSSDTKFIKDMYGRHTNCATHFDKDAGTEHCFGDRSRQAHRSRKIPKRFWLITLNAWLNTCKHIRYRLRPRSPRESVI